MHKAASCGWCSSVVDGVLWSFGETGDKINSKGYLYALEV